MGRGLNLPSHFETAEYHKVEQSHTHTQARPGHTHTHTQATLQLAAFNLVGPNGTRQG